MLCLRALHSVVILMNTTIERALLEAEKRGAHFQFYWYLRNANSE
jgi:hypothetical protein